MLVLAGSVGSAVGDTVYVRDTLYVPLRGGQSMEHRILHRGIRSGTKLERLDEVEDTGYSLVRMDTGMEGWIPTQYLVLAPVANDLLSDANNRLLALQEEHEKTLLQLQEIEVGQEQLDESHTSLVSENSELSEEVDRITALAANVIAIDEQNRALEEGQGLLLARIDELDTANQDLGDDANQLWFLGGACTMLVGLLFGFYAARRIYQKKGNSGWA